MNELREEIQKQRCQLCTEDRDVVRVGCVLSCGHNGHVGDVTELLSKLESSLAANREQEAELRDRNNHIDLAYDALGDINRSVYLFDHIREQKAEIEELIRKNREFAVVAEKLNKLVDRACDAGEASESELASLRASVGEKPEDAWIRASESLRKMAAYCFNEWGMTEAASRVMNIKNYAYVAPTLPGEEK